MEGIKEAETEREVRKRGTGQGRLEETGTKEGDEGRRKEGTEAGRDVECVIELRRTIYVSW